MGELGVEQVRRGNNGIDCSKPDFECACVENLRSHFTLGGREPHQITQTRLLRGSRSWETVVEVITRRAISYDSILDRSLLNLQLYTRSGRTPEDSLPSGNIEIKGIQPNGSRVGHNEASTGGLFV